MVEMFGTATLCTNVNALCSGTLHPEEVGRISIQIFYLYVSGDIDKFLRWSDSSNYSPRMQEMLLRPDLFQIKLAVHYENVT